MTISITVYFNRGNDCEHSRTIQCNVCYFQDMRRQNCGVDIDALIAEYTKRNISLYGRSDLRNVLHMVGKPTLAIGRTLEEDTSPEVSVSLFRRLGEEL